jgi:Fe-S cluster biogenesis protein NfuA
VNKQVIADGNYTYKSIQECENNPLAEALFCVSSAIKEIYFCDNFITVSQDGGAGWNYIQEKLRKVIADTIDNHDPHFAQGTHHHENATTNTITDPALLQINALLDTRVRPALQQDGGDLRVLSYEDHTLKIFYQGACGSCPSAAMGTLNAIQNLLRSEFDPEIVVEQA